MKRFICGALAVLFVGQSWASTIAVIDSGVDYKHKDLAQNIWANPENQTTTKDGTVYKADLHGWNFAEKNNQIIDYKYLGTFSEDCFKIFHIQAKILQGTATADEKSWYDAKKKDATFLKELGKFGNFVHGTHVSGISLKNATKGKVVAMKLIATEPPGGRALELAERLRSSGIADEDNPLAKLYLSLIAKQQANMLITVGKYTEAVKAEVANGSFGTSVAAVKPVLANLLKSLLGKDPTDAELEEYGKFFVQEIANASKDFVAAAPLTLFVFAAGNDGTNNDQLPCSPANIKADNSITVAATIGTTSLASFSNYGSAMVEVAAPGVAIVSTIPGDQTLPMSGTSMAAPFVTNVAGLVKDTNRALKAGDIKKVLMETVDVKNFLQGKVKTGGIVNASRAVRAAELSLTMTLAQAIQQARSEVTDMAWEMAMPARGEQDLLVLPLPQLVF